MEAPNAEEESGMSPAQLNSMEADVLFARVDAVIASFLVADEAERDPVASFMTNDLALRIHNRIQALHRCGACELPKQVALALVIMDMMGVPPPSNRGEIEKVGQRMDDALEVHANALRAITKRGNPPATKERQRIAEKCALFPIPWTTPPRFREGSAASPRVPRTVPRIARGGEGPSGDSAVRMLLAELQHARHATGDVERAEQRRDDARARAVAQAAAAKAAKKAEAEAARKRKVAELETEKEKAAAEREARKAQRLEKSWNAAKEESKQLKGELKQVKGDLERRGSQVTAANIELERAQCDHMRQTERLERAIESAEAEAAAARAKEAHLRDLKAAMAKRARVAEAAAAADTGGKRLDRANSAEGEVEAFKALTEELHEKLDAYERPERIGEEASPAALEVAQRLAAGKEALERLASMPTWRTKRPVSRKRGRGGGHAFDFDYRVAAYEQYSNGTPKSSIAPNIVSVIKRTAPWLKPQEATAHQLGNMRFELRTVEECCAGRRVASAKHVRVLGFDETTKDQELALTSNVQIQEVEAGPQINVVLRGAYMTPGGTSEQIAKAIDVKCFRRLRDLLRGWEKMFRELYPEEPWTGPDPEQLGLHRLGGGGAVMSDTCNAARKTGQLIVERVAALVQEMAGDEWSALSEEEQQARVRVHKLHCYNHMRNIFLGEMSRAQAAHVKASLQGHLDAFTSFERMTTDFDQVLRSHYKEFHSGGRYYKGKGAEMLQWMIDEYPDECYYHYERAEGGRQDLDFDAAVPVYMNRRFALLFLHRFVHMSGHSNILEDFLYSVLRSLEFIAMARANGIVDLLISRPLRWLAGKGKELTNWSPAKATWPFDLVEQTLQLAVSDGAVLLDPTRDIFAPIVAVQPLFRDYVKYTYKHDHILSPKKSASHLHWKQARDELLTPKDPTNQAPRALTIEYLEVQAAAGLRKFHDAKLALAEKLTSQDGAGCLAKTAQMHTDTMGVTNTNDELAESIFANFDRARKANPGISQPAASALAQSWVMKTFSHGDLVQHRKSRSGEPAPHVERGEGYFHTRLPKKEAVALVEYARVSLPEMRAIDAADAAEHHTNVKAKRKSEQMEELEGVVKGFVLAITFFKNWKKDAVRSVGAITAKMRTDFGHPTDAKKRAQAKLDWLRYQIDMRVLGFGWTECKTHWASKLNEHIGTEGELTGHLKDIIELENECDEAGELPAQACAPIMNRKVFKPLGRLTQQAGELTSPFVELSDEQLMERVMARRAQLQAAGEIDDLEEAQPPESEQPALDRSLITWTIEVGWRYWRPTVEGGHGHGPGKRRQEFIWAEGEVVGIEDATKVKVQPKCKELEGNWAVQIQWPEDADFEERSQKIWTVLQPKDFNKQVHLGWRLTAASIQRRAQAARAAKSPEKERRR